MSRPSTPPYSAVRSRCIVYVRNYVRTTRRGNPIYYNFPLMVVEEPVSLPELEYTVKLARGRAEKKIRLRGRGRIQPVMDFYILRIGKSKGAKKTEFVPLYPSIGVAITTPESPSLRRVFCIKVNLRSGRGETPSSPSR